MPSTGMSQLARPASRWDGYCATRVGRRRSARVPANHKEVPSTVAGRRSLRRAPSAALKNRAAAAKAAMRGHSRVGSWCGPLGGGRASVALWGEGRRHQRCGQCRCTRVPAMYAEPHTQHRRRREVLLGLRAGPFGEDSATEHGQRPQDGAPAHMVTTVTDAKVSRRGG